MNEFFRQFRDTDFPIHSIVEYQNRLPVGVLTTEKAILRDVQFRKLSRVDLKKIWDKKFSQNHPMQWIARVMSLVVESIDNEPVYSEFEASGFRDIPKIVKEIPMSDTSYIMILGHVHNFGWEIEKVRTQCIDEICERKQSIPVVSLKKMMVEYAEEDHHSIEVQLVDGLQVPDVDHNEKKIPHTRMTMRIPVVGDALKYENYFRSNEQGDFYERVYGDCLEELIQTDGNSLEEARLAAQAPGLIKTMSARDSAIMEGALNKVPALLMLIQESCAFCSEDLPVFIQQGFLFPRRQ